MNYALLGVGIFSAESAALPRSNHEGGSANFGCDLRFDSSNAYVIRVERTRLLCAGDAHVHRCAFGRARLRLRYLLLTTCELWEASNAREATPCKFV